MKDTTGKCHLCRQTKPILYCRSCDHWFCDDCRAKYWSRGLAAVKQLIGGKAPGCCGPSEKVRGMNQ